MSKHASFVFGIAIVSLFHAGCGEQEPSTGTSDDAIQAVYEGKLTLPQAQASCGCRLELVPIGGTVFHFGLDLSQSPPALLSVPVHRRRGARLHRRGSDHPALQHPLGRRTASGASRPSRSTESRFRSPLVYELAGYVTTKSQVFEMGDSGITDVAVQFPTEAYFSLAKGQIEQQIGGLIGAPYTLSNVLVTTVGKSWASMYSPQLPHGDPGAQVSISPAIAFPASLGPVYFNDRSRPIRP